MPSEYINKRVVFAGVKYDSDALAYFNQLSGGTSASYKASVNAFILSLKAAGNWTLLDRLYIRAAEVQQHARVSVKNPTSAQTTEVGSITWASRVGYTGDGATTYLNTNFIPTTDGVNYLLSSGIIGVYCTTTTASTGAAMGVADTNAPANGQSLIGPQRNGANSMRASVNDAAGTNYAHTSGSKGFFVCKRVDDLNKECFVNGVSVGSQASGMSNVAARPFYELATNDVGTASLFYDNTIAVTIYGGGAMNQAALYSSVQTLAISLGFNV